MGNVWRSLGVLSLLLGAIMLLSTVQGITGFTISEGLAGSMTSAGGVVFVLVGTLLVFASMRYA